MNALSALAAFSQFIATVKFLDFQMIALNLTVLCYVFILLMSFNDELAKHVCALSETSVLDT